MRITPKPIPSPDSTFIHPQTIKNHKEKTRYTTPKPHKFPPSALLWEGATFKPTPWGWGKRTPKNNTFPPTPPHQMKNDVLRPRRPRACPTLGTHLPTHISKAQEKVIRGYVELLNDFGSCQEAAQQRHAQRHTRPTEHNLDKPSGTWVRLGACYNFDNVTFWWMQGLEVLGLKNTPTRGNLGGGNFAKSRPPNLKPWTLTLNN